jgi:hypothetical protein
LEIIVKLTEEMREELENCSPDEREFFLLSIARALDIEETYVSLRESETDVTIKEVKEPSSDIGIPCDKDYYEVRQSGCEHGTAYMGRVRCSLEGCTSR